MGNQPDIPDVHDCGIMGHEWRWVSGIWWCERCGAEYLQVGG